MPFTSVTTFNDIADRFRYIELTADQETIGPNKITIKFEDNNYLNSTKRKATLILEFSKKISNLSRADFKLDENHPYIIDVSIPETKDDGKTWTSILEVLGDNVNKEYNIGVKNDLLEKNHLTGDSQKSFLIDTEIPTIEFSINPSTRNYTNDDVPEIILTFSNDVKLNSINSDKIKQIIGVDNTYSIIDLHHYDNKLKFVGIRR